MNEESPSQKSIPLKGIERIMLLDGFLRIAHVLEVSLSPTTDRPIKSLKYLYREAPRAWKWVTTRHPRMRAELPKVDENNKNPVATIRKGRLSDSALKATLTILDQATDQSFCWEDYVWEECHRPRPYRNTTETLFAMTILPLSPTKAALILFSDHIFSDGFSGYVILRDFLNVLTRTAPSNSHSRESDYFKDMPTALPLQDPIMMKLIPRTFFRRMYDRFIGKVMYGLSLIAVPNFKSIFPSSALSRGSHRKCTKNFASGSAENLSFALQRCREEGTTLLGPLCIAIALGMAQAIGDIVEDTTTTRIRSNMQLDYNLRDRVGMGKEHVGANFGVNNLFSFEQGLELEDSFWETARAIKKEATVAGDNTMFHAMFSFCEYIDLEGVKGLVRKAKDGVIDDVNISNLGRWPFGQQIGPLALDRVYLYHRLTGSDPAVTFFVTSVKSLQYSMTSKLADQTGMADKVFDTVVTIMESVGTISPTSTIREVLQQARRRHRVDNSMARKSRDGVSNRARTLF